MDGKKRKICEDECPYCGSKNDILPEVAMMSELGELIRVCVCLKCLKEFNQVYGYIETIF